MKWETTQEDSDRSRVLGDLAQNPNYSSWFRYQSLLLENVSRLKDLYPEDTFRETAAEELSMIQKIGEHV